MPKAPRRSSCAKKARTTSGPMSGPGTSALVAGAGGSSEDSVASLSLGELLDAVGEHVRLEVARAAPNTTVLAGGGELGEASTPADQGQSHMPGELTNVELWCFASGCCWVAVREVCYKVTLYLPHLFKEIGVSDDPLPFCI